MQNQFVMEFMKMRQNIHKNEEKKGTPLQQEPVDGITLATIVEEKPPAKDVAEYFKRLVQRIQTD